MTPEQVRDAVDAVRRIAACRRKLKEAAEARTETGQWARVGTTRRIISNPAHEALWAAVATAADLGDELL